MTHRYYSYAYSDEGRGGVRGKTGGAALRDDGGSPLVSLDEFVSRYRGDELLNFCDFPVNHVAICTGTRDDGDHVLLHASTVDGTNALWPLRRFDDYDRYRRIHAIRRLRPEFRYPGEGAPVSR